MIFFVIYTPNTVRLLSHFVQSLLVHSNCQFSLVSNGCREEEKDILRNLCIKEDRLTFIDLPTSSIWSHGKALNYLYLINQSDYFCFMDSDIFATNSYLDQFRTLIEKNTGVFSCSAIWMPEEDKVLPTNYSKLSGRYHRTSDGICLGSSYFAIYDCRRINALSSKIKVNFNKFKWENISLEYQQILISLNFKKKEYDTCRVFNLLLLYYGEKLVFEEAQNLVHIGGISARSTRKGILHNKQLAKILFLLPESIIKQKLLRLSAVSPRNIIKIFTKSGKYNAKRRVNKAVVTQYFSVLLKHLFYQQKKPKIPKLIDKEIQHKMEEASLKLFKYILKNQKQL